MAGTNQNKFGHDVEREVTLAKPSSVPCQSAAPRPRRQIRRAVRFICTSFMFLRTVVGVGVRLTAAISPSWGGGAGLNTRSGMIVKVEIGSGSAAELAVLSTFLGTRRGYIAC